MSRCSSLAACLVTLTLTAAAWGRSSFVNPTSAPAFSEKAAAVADTSGTADQQTGIKEQLRSTLTQFVVDEIHNLFTELRTSLGLPAEPTDPDTDLLAILETAITDMVENKLAD